MKVDVNYIIHLKNELAKINRVSLDKIHFFDGDDALKIEPEQIAHWELTGLSNVDFVTSGAYHGINQSLEQGVAAELPIERCDFCGTPLAAGSCENPSCDGLAIG